MENAEDNGSAGHSRYFYVCFEINGMEFEVHFIEKERLFYTNKKRCGKMICIMNSQDKHIRS